MSYLKIAAFLVIGVALVYSEKINSKTCVGCMQDVEVTDKALKYTLLKALSLQNDDIKVLKVLKAQRQVIAGLRYKVIFLAKINEKAKRCVIKYTLGLPKGAANGPINIESLICK